MSENCHSILRRTELRENTISTSRSLRSRFLGSFMELNQLPKDRRPQIAIAGRSNVGKSSLLNRLLGSRRLAKVSGTPGKTRSLNFFLVNDHFYLVDLPGYGYAKAPLSLKQKWGKLVKEYLETTEHIVGLILLLDCRRETTTQDNELVNWLTERQLPVLVALTKADKLSRVRLADKVRNAEIEFDTSVIACSASSGLGKNELVDAVRELVNRHVRF